MLRVDPVDPIGEAILTELGSTLSEARDAMKSSGYSLYSTY